MIKLLISNLKMTIRNKQALFWTLAFPLIFTVIFGFFFGSNSSSGTIALINNSKTELAEKFVSSIKNSDLFIIKEDQNESKARENLSKNLISSIVIIQEKFGEMGSEENKIKIIEDPANSQVNATVNSFTNQFIINIDYQIHKIEPTFKIDIEKTNNRTLNYFDFVLMGLIGMALMNSSVQGIAIAMANYREDKILKRITTTPLAPWKFILAEVIARLVINFVQISLILAIGYFGFDAHIYGNLFVLYSFALIGGVLFQCFGFMVAALTKTTDAAEGMATAITIPMMFLAGVFFPIDSLPKWLYGIVQYLPLAPLLRIIRTIGLEASSPFTNPINIIIVLIWIVFALGISIWKFRLAEE